MQTSQELLERLPALELLVRQIRDRIAGLQADCYAAALCAYRMPEGEDPAFDPLRAHLEQRLEWRRQTRAANRALQAIAKELARAGATMPADDGATRPAPPPAGAASVPAIPPRSAIAPVATAA